MAILLRALRRAFAPALLLLFLLPQVAHAAWPSGGLVVAGGAGSQKLKALATDGAGGAYVGWYDSTSSESRLVRVTAAGNVADGWPASGLAWPGRTWLEACEDGAGGMVIFLVDAIRANPASGGGMRDVLAWRVRSNGVLEPGWPSGGVPMYREQHTTTDPDSFATFVVTKSRPDGEGGAWLVFGYRGYYLLPSDGAWMARVLGWGSVGVSFPLVEANWFFVESMDMLPDGSGGLFVAFYQLPDRVVRHYDGNGVQLAEWVADIHGMDSYAMRLFARLPGDDLMMSWVTWYSEMLQTNRYNVVLDRSLQPRPGWAPSQVSGWIAWDSDGAGGAYGDRYDGAGHALQHLSLATNPPTPLWGASPPIGPAGSIAWDQGGGVFRLSHPTLAGVGPLTAQHFDAGGNPMPGWPAGAVTLSSAAWAAGGAPPLVIVEPGAAIAGWTDLASGSFDVMVQRLDEHILLPVDAPPRAPAAFALRGFAANPLREDATVELTLPDGAPATLTLHDVVGRVLARRDVGALGAGTHRVTLARSLPPGVVFARLERGGEVRVARAAVVR